MNGIIGKWQGQDAWIIAGGASLLQVLSVPAEIQSAIYQGSSYEQDLIGYLAPLFLFKNVIGVSDSYKLGNIIDILYFGDCSWPGQRKTEFNKFQKTIVTCCPQYSSGKFYGYPVQYLQRSKEKEWGLSIEKKTELVWNYNSGTSAINLAALMGAKRIFLLGYDMKDSRPLSHWWHTKDKDGKYTAPYERYLPAHEVVAHDAQELGIEIYNVNLPGVTEIAAYPIISFKTAQEIGSQK